MERKTKNNFFYFGLIIVFSVIVYFLISDISIDDKEKIQRIKQKIDILEKEDKSPLFYFFSIFGSVLSKI